MADNTPTRQDSAHWSPMERVSDMHYRATFDHLQGIGADLRRLADITDRLVQRVRTATTREQAEEELLDAASRVQHEVLWGLANLHLDALTTNAIQAAHASDLPANFIHSRPAPAVEQAVATNRASRRGR